MAPWGQPNFQSDDYYEILGVSRDASDTEIGKHYKKLALKCHPDKNRERKGEAEKNFKIVSEAYSALSDPEKRKVYDQCGRAGLEGDRSSHSRGASGPRFSAGGMSASHAEEVFRRFFGGDSALPGATGARAPFPGRGGDPRGPWACPFGLGGPGGPGGAPATPLTRGSRWPPAHALAAGTPVALWGLERAAEHNGKAGRVVVFDPDRGRYTVELEGGVALCLRPQNLTQRCAVEVVGLEGRPELNGRAGEVAGYSAATDRYLVLLADPPALSLQRGNCLLGLGTRIVVRGLSKAHLNGQMGQVTGIDRASGRYAVRCQNGEEVKVKYANVIC